MGITSAFVNVCPFVVIDSLSQWERAGVRGRSVHLP